MKFDKDEIKNSLSIEQVFDIVADLGGEPRMERDYFIAATICHNHPGEGSHKLYYYDNTKLFRCYTECNDTFDIFQLIIKVKKQEGQEWTLYNAISYVINYFSLEIIEDFSDKQINPQEWKILSKWEAKSQEDDRKKSVELKIFDDSFLKNFPRPKITPWLKEGITQEVMNTHNICYDPVNHGIIIPHYDMNWHLIGVRERTLIKENEELYGKYRPAIINKKMYNHPLSFALYNLNWSKDNIAKIQRAIVFESEKSCMKYASYFGQENDISVACCGSTLVRYQIELLLSLGVKEIIIAFDKEGEKDIKENYVKKFYNFYNKFGKLTQLSFIYDKEEKYLNYKDAPIDRGPEVFLQLFKTRIFLDEKSI